MEHPTVKDEMDFDKYDMIYMGSGTEKNQEIAIEDLKRYQTDIKKAIDNNKVFLITGNSIDIFGKELIGKETNHALGIFDYIAKYVPRIRKDVIYHADFLENPILGYENHNYVLENVQNPFWEGQGVKYNHFFGTYVEGPILVRNPELLKFFLGLLINEKELVDKVDLNLEEKAYDNFKTLLIKE